MKGPAAATLYGIQASNGVVRITTKHGRAGPARWNLLQRGGRRATTTTPIRSTTTAGIDPGDRHRRGFDGFCTIQSELDGVCTQTSVTQYSPLDDPSTRPLKAGLRQQYGANVSGGSDAVHLLPLGDYENEDGVFRLPQFEEDSVRETARHRCPTTSSGPTPSSGSTCAPTSRANVSADADVERQLGYISSDTRFVENDNSFLTITGSGEASGNLPRTSIGAGTSFPPSCSRSRPTRRPSGSPAGSPATGGR